MSVSFIHTGDLHLGRQFHFDQHTDTYGRDKSIIELNYSLLAVTFSILVKLT